MDHLSSAFQNRIVRVYGQAGSAWLEDLPRLRLDLLERWSLRDSHPVSEGSYNYLEFTRTTDGTPVVLKMAPPNPELDTEIKALRLFDGRHAVRLLEADSLAGALLLERILPGDTLLIVKDDEDSTRTAARLMKNLWRPAPPGNDFPSMADWCRGFQRYQRVYQEIQGPLPPGLVDHASALAAELLQNREIQLLLHGDLHQMNILKGAEENWITIDPKGVIGEPAFEVGPLVFNPIPDLIHWPELKIVLSRRLAILAEILELERKHLAAWSYVRMVLSAIWDVEEGCDPNYGVNIAQYLEKLL